MSHPQGRRLGEARSCPPLLRSEAWGQWHRRSGWRLRQATPEVLPPVVICAHGYSLLQQTLLK